MDVCDRLSELPDSLILEILSLLLNLEDVVRTSLLSKRWKDVWTTVPCLRISIHTYKCKGRNYISNLLTRWKGAKILKFTFSFYSDLVHADDMDSYLLFAIEKKVEELRIHPGLTTTKYCAPQNLYSCSSLTKLSFVTCALRIEEDGHVQWKKLKTLEIWLLKSWSEDAMDKILNGAPLLEELLLTFCEISGSINIRSRSLKRLSLHTWYFFDATITHERPTLRIWAPNLETLEVGPVFGGGCFLDVPSLINALLCFHMYGNGNKKMPSEMFRQFFTSICHAEKVELSVLCYQFLAYRKEKDMVVRFPNAKFLTLFVDKAGQELLDVLEMFPNLMVLKIRLEKEHSYHKVEIHEVMVQTCNSFPSKYILFNPSLLQHVKTVEISWCLCEASMIPMVELLLANARVLERLVLRLPAHRLSACVVNPETLSLVEEKVLSMWRSSPNAQVIITMKEC